MIIANARIINLIANSVYWADRQARAELALGILVKEDDYTSNFTANIRRNINGLGLPSITAHSQVNSPSIERSTGTDAVIVISNGHVHKVGYFEAKWPRYSLGAYPWDANSRFAKQIATQAILSPNCAVWEMFYCEYPFLTQPSGFPNFLSACVSYSDAAAYQATNSITRWDRKKLDPLLKSSMVTVDHLVRQMCNCSIGVKQRGGWKGFASFNDGFEPAYELILNIRE